MSPSARGGEVRLADVGAEIEATVLSDARLVAFVFRHLIEDTDGAGGGNERTRAATVFGGDFRAACFANMVDNSAAQFAAPVIRPRVFATASIAMLSFSPTRAPRRTDRSDNVKRFLLERAVSPSSTGVATTAPALAWDATMISSSRPSKNCPVSISLGRCRNAGKWLRCGARFPLADLRGCSTRP